VVKIKDYRNILAGNSKLLDSPQQETHISLTLEGDHTAPHYIHGIISPSHYCMPHAKQQRAPIIVTENFVCLPVCYTLVIASTTAKFVIEILSLTGNLITLRFSELNSVIKFTQDTHVS